jgi:arylsulfatase A-like enzyme
VSAATLGLWRTPAPPAAAAGERPPNLVLVIIDTLRQDSFASIVRQTAEGRAFRQAMAGSAWFSRAVAAAPWTVPSVGSIMTGLYPQEHGFHAAPVKSSGQPLRPLSESVPTLAQRLKRRGYWTEGIGTNPLLQPVSGIARGFDHYEILSGPTVKLPPLTALARLDLMRDDIYQQAGSVRRRFAQRLGPMTASGRPVFLWLHLMDPHAPLHSHRGLAADPRLARLDELRGLYHDEVRYALRELTAVLRLLRDHDLWHNTALVVVADHGEMFPTDGHDNGVTRLDRTQPKLYGHGHALYAELVNVPLVIRPPGGLPKSRRVTTLTSHVDLHDTILDLLGVTGERIGGDRVSLAPWLRAAPPDPEPRGRKRVLIGANQHGPKQRALRTFRYKLIDYPRGERPSELYNIAADSRERRDLAGLDKRRLSRLERSLESAWQELSEAPPADPAELDAETLKRLKALGYLP